jgi:single-strand selective monofunctional uracil DNA glycosylase
VKLTRIARELASALSALRFGPPVSHVYHPTDYGWRAHRAYLERYGSGHPRVLLVGMNAGPWGMAQTGVPFGDVGMVRDWLGIRIGVRKPDKEHPKRPVEGLGCRRNEVSGRRLWGWARDAFGTPEAFFRRFFVINYCPLCFLEEGGRNIPPDRLRSSDRKKLFPPCDEALRRTVEELSPQIVLGVGRFAEERAKTTLGGGLIIGGIPHPSPASPLANRGWRREVERQLTALRVL